MDKERAVPAQQFNVPSDTLGQVAIEESSPRFSRTNAGSLVELGERNGKSKDTRCFPPAPAKVRHAAMHKRNRRADNRRNEGALSQRSAALTASTLQQSPVRPGCRPRP